MPVQFGLPLVALAVIFFWAVHRSPQLPSPVVFLIGLFTDLATAGPLGFWAFNYLAGYAIASYAPEWYRDRLNGTATWIFFSLAVALSSLLGWLLTSLFALQTTPVRPMLLGGVIAVAAYPVISLLLGPLERLVGRAAQAARFRQADLL